MRRPSFWMRAVHAGIAASVEALFPANDLGAPCWRETEMTARTLRWIAALPPAPRGQIQLLFGAIELGAPLLGPAFGRLSSLPAEKRLRIFQRWHGSWFKPLRILADALKASTTMIYLSHPAALAYIGLHKACENTDDPLQVPIEPLALTR